MFNRFVSVVAIMSLLMLFSCKTKKSTDPTESNADIPADPTNVTVPATTENNIVPAATFEMTPSNTSRIIVNLLGLVNPITNQPIELFANYSSGTHNVYLEEDGVLKGIKLTKVSTSNILKADVVFTVDISGSMGQEADSVANSIIEFANFLAASGLDVLFGSVGYYGYIAGALNLTDATSLETYLNKSYGTYRPQGFAGPDSAALVAAASTFHNNHGYYDENGIVGIFFADSLFNWRPGAQRVFVNFTDEPTQPSGMTEWSTANLCQKMVGKATVHTVFSEDTTYGYWQDLYNERPWKMSECTGGTVKFLDSYATGLDLTNLPVAGALSNSYKLEFLTASPSGSHTVIITVKTTGADGKIEYVDVSYGG